MYVSSAKRPFTEDELEALLRRSREKNARLGITGVLIYSDGNFMQCLEGPGDRVRGLYEEILKDDRHHRVILVYQEKVAGKFFENGWMAYARITSEQGSALFKGERGSNPTPRLLHEFLTNGRLLG